MQSNIHELTDDLLAVEWGPRFESFTTKETVFLARYNDFAWLLGNRSFFREPSRLSVTASTTLTHAGTESLELAAITLVKAWQKGDTPHEKVTAILRGRATGEDHDETVEMLDALDALFEARRGETLMSYGAVRVRYGRRGPGRRC